MLNTILKLATLIGLLIAYDMGVGVADVSLIHTVLSKQTTSVFTPINSNIVCMPSLIKEVDLNVSEKYQPHCVEVCNRQSRTMDDLSDSDRATILRKSMSNVNDLSSLQGFTWAALIIVILWLVACLILNYVLSFSESCGRGGR